MSRASARASRVLVVDDEDNITFLLESALRHFGYDVRAVENGRDALEAVRSFAPDLVVLDVMLLPATPGWWTPTSACCARRSTGWTRR